MSWKPPWFSMYSSGTRQIQAGLSSNPAVGLQSQTCQRSIVTCWLRCHALVELVGSVCRCLMNLEGIPAVGGRNRLLAPLLENEKFRRLVADAHEPLSFKGPCLVTTSESMNLMDANLQVSGVRLETGLSRRCFLEKPIAHDRIEILWRQVAKFGTIADVDEGGKLAQLATPPRQPSTSSARRDTALVHASPFNLVFYSHQQNPTTHSRVSDPVQCNVLLQATSHDCPPQ